MSENSNDYYVGNGIYGYLIEQNSRDRFYWCCKDLWMLVYGDNCCNPKILAVISSSSSDTCNDTELEAIDYAESIAKGTGIPVVFVRYNPDSDNDTIQYWDSTVSEKVSCSNITFDILKNYFSKFGLSVNNSKTTKDINSKSSSAYHDWQRANLGNDVIVCDIDLIRCKRNEPVELIELKRSLKKPEDWSPYPDDYNNYKLIFNLSKQCSLDFCVVYNYRNKASGEEDISVLKVYEYSENQTPPFKLMGYTNIDSFIKSDTKEINYDKSVS